MRKTRQNFLLPAIPIGFFLVCSLYLQKAKAPWVDECYTYYGITHYSFDQFVDSICSGINFSPPLYFLLNWIIQLVFNLPIEALRIESALWIALGSFLIFRRCAKCFGFASSFVGLSLVLLQSNLLIEQALEARHYGMFFACSCMVLLFFPEDSKTESKKTKILYFFSLLALGLTHYIGIVFCLITGCTRLWFLRKKSVKLTQLLPEISSLVILTTTYLTLLSKQSSHLNTWQKDNSLEALLNVYLDSITPLTVLALALPALILMPAKKPEFSETEDEKGKNIVPISLVVISFIWVLVPFFFWILSHASELNLFQGRYFIPKETAIIVILCFCCKTLVKRFTPIKHKLPNAIVLMPVLASLMICALSTKRTMFGLSSSSNYHHRLITNRKIAQDPFPKFYLGDHVFFPNRYMNKSDSNDHLIVTNKKLGDVYQNFDSTIKTSALGKQRTHSHILIVEKGKFSSNENLYPKSNIRSTELADANDLISVHKIETIEKKFK